MTLGDVHNIGSGLARLCSVEGLPAYFSWTATSPEAGKPLKSLNLGINLVIYDLKIISIIGETDDIL